MSENFEKNIIFRQIFESSCGVF